MKKVLNAKEYSKKYINLANHFMLQSFSSMTYNLSAIIYFITLRLSFILTSYPDFISL